MEEASFFLEKIHSANLATDEFKYYVSACVWALYGSFDHLLYDYAMKFWPNLSVDDYLENRIFSLLAKATGNEEAEHFLQWYRQAQGRIDKDRDASTVLKARRVEAHRGSVDYDYTFTLHAMLNLSGSIEVRTFYTGAVPTGLTATIDPNAIPATEAHFAGYPDNSVEVAIQNTFRLLSGFVSEAENRFGRP